MRLANDDELEIADAMSNAIVHDMAAKELDVNAGVGIMVTVLVKLMALVKPQEREQYLQDVATCLRSTAEINDLIPPKQ